MSISFSNSNSFPLSPRGGIFDAGLPLVHYTIKNVRRSFIIVKEATAVSTSTVYVF